MVQQGKELAAKRDKVSLTPGTHMVEGENQLQQVVLWPLFSCGDTHPTGLPTHI